MKLHDGLRDAESRLKDLEFEAMLGSENDTQVSLAKESVERAKREICACLDPNPIAYQRILIIREAESRGFDPDIYAETWIAWNSRKFRKMWDEGERRIEEFEKLTRIDRKV